MGKQSLILSFLSLHNLLQSRNPISLTQWEARVQGSLAKWPPWGPGQGIKGWKVDVRVEGGKLEQLWTVQGVEKRLLREIGYGAQELTCQAEVISPG